MKNSERKKTEGGFIALTSVLIIGAVVLVLGVSLFHSALTDYSISSAYESGQEAAFLADFCLKEGVLKLKENIDYEGAEDIEVDDTTCYIGSVENVDDNDNTKKVSSLGRAGDQPHFSRSSQLIRYVIESSADDWEREGAELKNLIVGDSLKLQSAETKTVLNSASEISCNTKCQQEGTYYRCISIGTNYPDADKGEVQACEKGLWHFDEDSGIGVRDSSGNGNHGTLYGNNEVTEGGFETSNYWSDVTRATSIVYTGTYSGEVIKESAGELTKFHGEMIIPDSSVQYQYGGCIYSNGPNADIYFFSWDEGSSKYDGTYDHISTLQTNQWVCISGITTNVVSADDYFDIRIDNNGGAAGAGTVWFDDIWARKVTSDSSWTTGKYGSGLSFDGVDDYVTMGDPSTLDVGTSDWSAEAWIKTTDTSSLFISKAWSTPYYYLGISSGNFKATLHNGSSALSVNSNTAINDNSWHHVAAVYDRDADLSVYVDGEYKNGIDISGSAGVDISNTNDFSLGCNCNAGCAGTGNFLNGTIDEVRILDIALTPEQIQDDYNATKGCGTIIPDYSEEIPDCDGHPSAWTYCKCKPEKSEGYRISPEFDISGPDTVNPDIVKDSQIFWQADERFDGTIEVKVSYDGGNTWSDEQIVNGAGIPGLEPGTSLSGVKMKTKTSFVGGPVFYPILENIKIFIELE